MQTLRSLFTATTVFLTVILAVPALAQLEIPEGWYGIWETEIALYDCDTNALLFSTTGRDTTCPGSVIEEPEGGGDGVTCTYSGDANSMEMHCEGSEEVAPGCMANFEFDMTTTRTDDSYTSTGITTISYSGDCPFSEESCSRTEISGTRISSDLGPCDSLPVESRPWAAVKAIYR